MNSPAEWALVREVIAPILADLARLEIGEYDLRNEGSVRYARAATDATQNIGLPLV